MENNTYHFKFNFNINVKFLILFAFYQFTMIFEKFEFIGYIIYYILPIVYMLINYKYLLRIIGLFLKKDNLSFVVSFLLCALITLLFPIIHGTYDFSAFLNEPLSLVKLLVMQIFLLIIYVKYVSSNPNIEEYIHYYILSCVLYVIGTMIMLAFPSVKEFFWINLKDNEHARNVALQADYITRYGWSGFSNFEHSIKCSIAIAFLGFLFQKENYYKNFLYYLLVIFCFIGNLFYSRIGIVASGIVILFIIFLLFKKESRLARMFVLLIVGLIAFILILSKFNSSIANWTNWIFINIINLFNGSGLLTGSLGIVFNNMMFVPDISTFLMGDGLYTSVTGGYYMNTDLGFMRTILFGGIPYLIARYGCFVSNLFILYRNDKKKKILLFLICIVFLLGEIKGEILPTFLAILIPVFIISNKDIFSDLER